MLEAAKLFLNVDVEQVMKGNINLMQIAIPLASHLMNFTIIKMVEAEPQQLLNVSNNRVVSFTELLDNVSFFANVIKMLLRLKCDGGFKVQAKKHVKEFKKNLKLELGEVGSMVLSTVLRETALVGSRVHAKMAHHIHVMFMNHHSPRVTNQRLATFVNHKHGKDFRVRFISDAMFGGSSDSSKKKNKHKSNSDSDSNTESVDVFKRQQQIHSNAFQAAFKATKAKIVKTKCELQLSELVEKLGGDLHGRVVIHYQLMRYYLHTNRKQLTMVPIVTHSGFRFGVFGAMIKDFQTRSKCNLLLFSSSFFLLFFSSFFLLFFSSFLLLFFFFSSFFLLFFFFFSSFFLLFFFFFSSFFLLPVFSFSSSDCDVLICFSRDQLIHDDFTHSLR